MRVSDQLNFGSIREAVARSKSRMDNLQGQHSTLRKLNTPSDNPVGSAKVLEIRTDKVNTEQFGSNGKLAETFLGMTEQALADLGEIVIRAKEIAIGQASEASSNPESRLGVAEEIFQLFQQAVSTANRKLGDRYLFGGYKTDRPPVNEQGRYAGDDGKMMIEIGKGVFVSMNLPGLDAFNTQPKSSQDFAELLNRNAKQAEETPTLQTREPGSNGETEKSSPSGNKGDRVISGEARDPLKSEVPERGDKQNVNVFDELQNLRIGLLTGDMEQIRGTLERFDQLLGHVTAMRSKIGSRTQGIQSTIQALDRQGITQAQLSQSIEDADMAQVVSDLAREEQIFRSSLAASQKLIQPTLLEFLK